MPKILQQRFPNLPKIATDASPDMVGKLQTSIDTDDLRKVRAKVEDATNLTGVSDQSITHTMTLSMIASAADPQKAANEIYRVTKLGGIWGCSAWVGICWSA
ncbi:hypothetical protein LTR36_010892 [Oleoguttula mirabilis]|uniref:Methyltransferase type 11 domain-containing protein n=1 Tax=Oleoguttula mirabilis TaxID=1507867 RepID=A0AAV9J4B6_9PEZI|nr:hypothetical protein LTR36_010892 [Oleoguttula mirabilis]